MCWRIQTYRNKYCISEVSVFHDLRNLSQYLIKMHVRYKFMKRKNEDSLPTWILYFKYYFVNTIHWKYRQTYGHLVKNVNKLFFFVLEFANGKRIRLGVGTNVVKMLMRRKECERAGIKDKRYYKFAWNNSWNCRSPCRVVHCNSLLWLSILARVVGRVSSQLYKVGDGLASRISI